MLDRLFLQPATGSPLITRYHWFGDGLNLLKLNNDTIDPATSQTFTYDDAQRLLSGTGPYGSRTYTYDKVGNRLSESKVVSGTTTNTTYAYPTTSNRLTSVKQGTTATRAFTYDAAGDTTQDTRGSTAYNFTINDAGRISQLKIGTTVTANTTYDAKARLSVRQTLNMMPAGTTQYLYDVWDHIVAETNGSGTVVKEYIWVGDMPVAVLDGSTTPSNPTLLYVHADHLNRPELMTNASQAVVWKAVYEPFGAVSSITGSATLNARFPGQWFQLEAGLHYNWHRHYDPTTGRYTSPDPLGLFLGPNAAEPKTITGSLLSAGLTRMGQSSPPNSSALASTSYPLALLSLSDIGGSPNGSPTKSQSVATSQVLKDGPSLYGYVRGNPLWATDKTGLVGSFTPIPPTTPNLCNYNCASIRKNCRDKCTKLFVENPELLPGFGKNFQPRLVQCINVCAEQFGC